MNIRLSNREIRFRISYEEFARLKNGETLNEETAFPYETSLSYSIKRSKNYDCRFHENSLILHVPESYIQLLEKKLPSKDGLEEEISVSQGTSLKLSLEVDVKTKRKKL